jgi:hypothetical protein
MDKKVYLLLKTHNDTGLKYLCRHITINEGTCYTYKGSGIVWTRHLKKHGNNVTTEILAKCNTIEEAKVLGLHYSEKWNIVESKEFANLVPEEGQGGPEPVKHRKKHGNRFGYEREPNRYLGDDNYAKLPEVRQKISEKLLGREITWKDKISKSCKGNTPWNKGKPNPHARTDHMNNIPPIKCPHCGKQGPKGAMVRWHFDNCKTIKTNN